MAQQKAYVGTVQPIEALKQQAIALDAAMLIVVTAAEVGAVHKLRTGTRRVEAHLVLLDILSTGADGLKLPPHRKEANAVRKHLRRLRRAAASVRDLDVQMETIEYDAPERAAVHEGTLGDAVRHEAKQLRKHLKHARAIEADKLMELLKRKERKVAASLQALEEALKHVSEPAMSAARVLERVRQWFTGKTFEQVHVRQRKDQTGEEAVKLAVERLGEDALHCLRKTAKLCRYMAEAVPKGLPAKTAVEQFESLQEAGGRWHDWLLLTQISRGFHGKKAELTQRYAKHCDAALADYRLRLSELLPVLTK